LIINKIKNPSSKGWGFFINKFFFLKEMWIKEKLMHGVACGYYSKHIFYDDSYCKPAPECKFVKWVAAATKQVYFLW
jgi:hypothetical protein